MKKIENGLVDKMIPIKGEFQIESIDKDGNIIDSYKDQNTIMTRVPQLFAGQTSGLWKKDIAEYLIVTIAIGTNGTEVTQLGDYTPKYVRNTRTNLFSENAFWNSTNPLAPTLQDNQKYTYQFTFSVVPWGDQGKSTASGAAVDYVNQGMNYPHTAWIPDKFRESATPPDDIDKTVGTIAVKGNLVTYNLMIGQNVANDPIITGEPVNYNEAALYMQLDSTPNGNPLGTLFSMKTFPNIRKDDTCSIKIRWRLFF